MARMRRQTAYKVIGGKVQRRDRRAATPGYWNTPQRVPAIDRRKPGKGYMHLLRKQHIHDFIAILPDWDELARGLNAIVLAPGNDHSDGWHNSAGVIALTAWRRELWMAYEERYVDAHRSLFERLGVPVRPANDGRYLCEWTGATARAYQLLHILLHELGHHHDRMTTRSRRRTAHGERFAEAHANAYAGVIWDRYCEVFGAPG